MRARLKEFGTREKVIRGLKVEVKVKNQVRKIICKELEYISGFFSYNIRNFYNAGLVYSQGVLLLSDSKKTYVPMSPPFMEKLVNLLAGIELLAIGVDFHNFKTDGASIIKGKKIASRECM